MTITGDQVKAARALVGWSQAKLAAERSGLTKATIAKFEEGKQPPATLDLSVVRRMLVDAGVEFVAEDDGQPGVKLRSKNASSDEAAIPPFTPGDPHGASRG